MRHRRSKTRLKQKPGHARMLKRNLITSLLLYENMRTTKKRAAVITPEIDKIITFAKKSSGLTRTKAVGSRDGDGAELVDISFVDNTPKTL